MPFLLMTTRRILLALIPAVFASFIPRIAAAETNDSLVVAKLFAERSQHDCARPGDDACRVVRQYSASEIEARLAAGKEVWQEGDNISFATRAKAESVELSGGLQFPMSRIAGTDLWVITVHVNNIESAVISYFFIPEGEGIQLPSRFTPKSWRGPKAPAPALASSKIQGKISVDTLKSAYLADPRAVVVYVPPAHGNDPIAGVVYLGDGGSVHSLAKNVDTLVVMGVLPRILLVGMVSGRATHGVDQANDFRGMEYLWNFEKGNAHFLAHENFWLREVIPYAETKYGAPSDASRRAVWGASNSAGWAISMALRHPDVVRNVLAFSPGGGTEEIVSGASFDPSVRFLLQAGTLEPSFHSIAWSWGKLLNEHGVKATLRDAVAGHDWEVWSDSFAPALSWAFSRLRAE